MENGPYINDFPNKTSIQFCHVWFPEVLHWSSFQVVLDWFCILIEGPEWNCLDKCLGIYHIDLWALERFFRVVPVISWIFIIWFWMNRCLITDETSDTWWNITFSGGLMSQCPKSQGLGTQENFSIFWWGFQHFQSWFPSHFLQWNHGVPSSLLSFPFGPSMIFPIFQQKIHDFLTVRNIPSGKRLHSMENHHAVIG